MLDNNIAYRSLCAYSFQTPLQTKFLGLTAMNWVFVVFGFFFFVYFFWIFSALYIALPLALFFVFVIVAIIKTPIVAIKHEISLRKTLKGTRMKILLENRLDI